MRSSKTVFLGGILFWFTLSNQSWWAGVISPRPNICFRNDRRRIYICFPEDISKYQRKSSKAQKFYMKYSFPRAGNPTMTSTCLFRRIYGYNNAFQRINSKVQNLNMSKREERMYVLEKMTRMANLGLLFLALP